VDTPFWEQQSFPEKLFRSIVLGCIVGWGLSAIYLVSHVGSMEDAYVRARDLAWYFFAAIWIFVFFYAQYRLVSRLLHRNLDRRVGLWHAGGSLALLLVGALNTVFPQTASDLPASLLFWITLLGEAAFIGNVIWSYVQGEPQVPFLPVVPTAKTTPERVRDDSPKNMGWPKTPDKLFGIGAAAFAAGGVISLILNMPSYKVGVPWSGELHFLPMGLLWMAAAAPFALFAMLYKYLMDAHNLVFKESMNRIHFVVTIIAVLDLVRVFMVWAWWTGSKFADFFGTEFQGVAMLFGMGAVVFSISAYWSYRRIAART
jgi:hypothetical protein